MSNPGAFFVKDYGSDSSILNQPYPFIFLLRDDFIFPRSAPLSSPRTCEPGPGTLTLVQTDGQFSIANGALVFPAQSTPVWGDQGFYGGQITVEPGISLLAKLRYTNVLQHAPISWQTAANVNITSSRFAEHISGTGIPQAILNGATYVTLNSALSTATDYLFSAIQRKGGFYLLQRTASGSWIITWINEAIAGNYYPAFSNINAVGTLDTLRVAKLPGDPGDTQPGNGYEEWGLRDLDITYSKASPVQNDAFTHTPNTLITHTLTALPVGNDTVWVFRSPTPTLNNCLALYIYATSGNVRLYEITGGSYVNIGQALSAVSGGETISVLAYGTTIKVFVNGSLIFTATSTTTFMNETKGYMVTAVVGTTMSNFVVKTLDGAATYGWSADPGLLNGGFDTDTGWTKGTGWTIAGGVASHAGGAGNVSQASLIVAGKTYTVTFDITSYTSGNVGLPGSLIPGGYYPNAVGSYSRTFTAASSTSMALYADGTASIDNVTLTEVNPLAAPVAYNQGQTTLNDGDMEYPDTSVWLVSNSATLSKQTTDPQSGSRLLRIAYNAVNEPGAYQACISAGRSYRAQGYCRSDGSKTAQVRDGTVVLFTSTTSTDWQAFDVTFSATASNFVLKNTATSAGYVEFDSVTLTEVTVDNNPGAGIATRVLPGPRAVNNWFTHEADFIQESLLPVLPGANLTVSFREQDVNNRWYWQARSTGEIRLYEIVTGTPTLRASVGAGTLSGGERLIVLAEGSTIKFYHNTTLDFTYSSATNYQTETEGTIYDMGSGRLSDLITWPRSLTSAPNTPGAATALIALQRMEA